MQADGSVEKSLGDMTTGFESLYEEVKALRSRNKCLQARLDAVSNEKPRSPAATEDGKDSTSIRAPQKDEAANEEECSAVKTACEIAEKRSKKRANIPKIALPEGHPEVEMEQDFTTPGGSQGNLGCPFAAMMAGKEAAKETTGRKGRKPGEASTATSKSARDPVAAEFHSSSGKSQPTQVEDVPPTCPIRFLDQHKPEEMAQYFENHKHEIPRSHEVCIKRYQSNEQSIRQLDAKYGSLVNMIQGLGKKHKPMLEEKTDEDDEQGSQALSDKDIAKIENWAGGIASEPVAEPVLAEQLADAEEVENEGRGRQPQFDKPLREIRLGESPSRPWGIQVPEHAEKASAKEELDEAAKNTVEAKGTEDVFVSQKLPSASTMAFNGPVFFGYSAEDVSKLFRQVPELRKASD